MSEQLLIQKSTLVDIADAIRAKTGSTEEIDVTNLASEIEDNISIGVELPGLTNPASASHILEGYEVIDESGQVIAGEMPTVCVSDYAVGVDENGVIRTHFGIYEDGFISNNEYFLEKQLDTQEAKTITPSTTEQIAVEAGKYTTGEVKVAVIPDEYIVTADATASADDIMNGETAYVDGSKVTGTMTNNGAISSTMDGINTKSVSIPSGYTTGGTVSLDDTIDNEVNEQADLITQIKSVVDNLPSADSSDSGSYDEGYAAGKSDSWNTFWDDFQQSGTRTNYISAFYSWRLADNIF